MAKCHNNKTGGIKIKKIKRKPSLLTAVLMLGSFTPESLAEGETEQSAGAEPEVLFYRDYEEYTGGTDIASNGKNHGTMNFAFNEFKKSVAVDNLPIMAVRWTFRLLYMHNGMRNSYMLPQ